MIGRDPKHSTDRGDRVRVGVGTERGLESPNVGFAGQSREAGDLPRAYPTESTRPTQPFADHDQRIAPSNTLVKPNSDQPVGGRGMLSDMGDSTADMAGLRERLQRVIDAGHVRNPSTWATSAGLARSHVNTILAGRTKRVETDTIYRLADAAKVSRAWLAFAQGSMVESDLVPGPWEAAKAWFLALEGHDGRGEEAKAFLLERGATLYAGSQDRGPEWWLAQLRDEFRGWRRPSKVVGVREIPEEELERPAKLNPRRAR